jgi:hypothetical protein
MAHVCGLSPPMSYRVIIVCESNISQAALETTASPAVGPAHAHALAELLIALWSLVPGVARQHALDAHAHALDALHRGPARGAEKVQADDSITVYVRVDGDGAAGERGGGLGRGGRGLRL